MVLGVRWHSLSVHYPENLQLLFETIITKAKLPALGKDDLFALELSFVEAMNNAFIHGNKRNSEKSVQIDYRYDGETFEIKITDEGKGFDGDKVPDPLEDDNLTKDCGRGLLLISHYMDDVHYNSQGNQVYMKKQIIRP